MAHHRTTRRSATRKPVRLGPHDAHVEQYRHELAVIACADPEDLTPTEARMFQAAPRHHMPVG